MIVSDINVRLYAYDAASPFHAKAVSYEHYPWVHPASNISKYHSLAHESARVSYKISRKSNWKPGRTGSP